MAEPFVTSISPLWESFPGTERADKNVETPEIPFASIFQSAIENVRETDAAKNEMQYLLATGQLDNPSELTIASTKASVAVELLVQLRTKALESYNELIRMSL